MVKHSPRLRVLVVDDEPLIRWSLAETLEQSGHAVVEAGDAASAIRTVSAGDPFDVVLLDYRLPDSNDLNLLATIRKLTGRVHSGEQPPRKVLQVGHYRCPPAGSSIYPNTTKSHQPKSSSQP